MGLTRAQQMMNNDGKLQTAMCQEARRWLEEEEKAGRLTPDEVAAMAAVRGGKGVRLNVHESFSGVYAMETSKFHRTRESFVRALKQSGLAEYVDGAPSSFEKAAENEPLHELANDIQKRDITKRFKENLDANGNFTGNFTHEAVVLGKPGPRRKLSREDKRHGW